MENIRVEYIILVETKNSFCNSVKSFNKLLEVNDNIKVERNKSIKFKDLELYYEVQTGELDEKGQRFFHLKFGCTQETKINEYSEFLKIIREIVIKITGKQPVSLWDDISFYYANKAYPLIHEIENLMRKLLTKFAITKFDSNWTEKNIPDEVKISIKNKELSNEANYLYQTDFNQLTNFLSGKIKTLEISSLIEKIKNAKQIGELDLEDLKSYIPTNNWDKYFSKIVDFDLDFLEKRWNKLYLLRCKVAHNNFLIKKDYEDICRYVDDLKPKLLKAIDELDNVIIDEGDKELLAENFALSSNSLNEEFLNLWKLIEKELYSLISSTKLNLPLNRPDKYSFNPTEMVQILSKNNLINETTILEIELFKRMRNQMVHEIENQISTESVEKAIIRLKEIINMLKLLTIKYT